MKVKDVKRPDVAAMMKKLEPTPMEASHTLTVMRKMFREAHRMRSTVPRHEGSFYVLPSLCNPLKYMTNGEYYNGWSRILKAAGLQHVGTHVIRHRSATDIANSGIPVKVAWCCTTPCRVGVWCSTVRRRQEDSGRRHRSGGGLLLSGLATENR